jgi:hypothetical protein
LEFKDRKLEEEYFNEIQVPRVRMFGKFIVTFIYLVNLADNMFELKEYINQVKDPIILMYKMLMNVVILTLTLSHYLLARKFGGIYVRSFSCLQTFICVVGIIEKSLIKIEDIDDIDIFIVILSIITAISFVSYS